MEASVEQRLKQATQAVDAAIDQAAVLLQANGITNQADYDALPLELTVRVISGFGRRFLELMSKVDQLMPLLDTLVIDGVITQRDHTIQKSAFMKSVRSIAGGARNFAGGLRRRMHELAGSGRAELAPKQQRGEAAAASILPAEGAITAGERIPDHGIGGAEEPVSPEPAGPVPYNSSAHGQWCGAADC